MGNLITTCAQTVLNIKSGIMSAAIDVQTDIRAMAADNNGGSDVLNKIFSPVVDFMESLTGYVYVAVIIVVFALGLMFMGGQRTREKAREWVPYILAGAILSVGAVTIGSALTNTFSF